MLLLPESRRKGMAQQHVHVDPEWETFTYGDPTPPKRSLRHLNPGDFLVFYCGLQEWDAEKGWKGELRPALYLAGYFEVALAGMAGDFEKRVLTTEFGKNFHVRYPICLRVAKGRPGAGQGRCRQPVVSEGDAGSAPLARTGRETAQGVIARDAENLRHFRRPHIDSTKSAPLG